MLTIESNKLGIPDAALFRAAGTCLKMRLPP